MQIGNNYLRGLFALAFQGFFMMVCVGIKRKPYCRRNPKTDQLPFRQVENDLILDLG